MSTITSARKGQGLGSRLGPTFGVLLGTLAAASACRPREPAPEPPRPEVGPTQADDAGPSLVAIADAIDPGPRAALTVELPAWLSTALGLPTGGEPRALLAEARAEWARWKAQDGGGQAAQLAKLVGLARALALAERAAGTVEQADVEVLLVLERLYAVLDAPTLANDRNAFAQTIQGFVGTLARHGEVDASVALDELARLVFGALQRSGELHRRTVAALLRNAPEHPDVPDVLGRLAPKLLASDEALAVGVLRRALALRGEAATAAHWLDLSTVCSRALDVRCAREGLARAEALVPTDDEALARRLADARTLADHARRAVELRDAAGLDDGLDRAGALYALQRYDEARALYERLHRRHPDDARPVVGQARTVLANDYDFVAAFDLLERAQPRDHLDRAWYELTIGVRATALLYHVLPQVMNREPDEIFATLRPGLVRLRQDIEALEALGAEEGRVLRFVYDLGMEAWPRSRAEDSGPMIELARGLLTRTRALSTEVPGSAHAYTLLLAAAEFSADRAEALAVLDVVPPPEHAEALAVRRAQAALDLVAAWDARDHVEAMLGLVSAVDGPSQPREVRRLVLDAEVLARRLGAGQAGWSAIESRYRALVVEPGGASDALLLNNLAVVVAELGRHEEAQALWAQALEHAAQDAVDLVRLTAIAGRIVAAAGAGPSAEDRAALQTLTDVGRSVDVRLQAHAWLVAIAPPAERRAAERRLREVAAEEAARNYRPRNLPGQGAVILRGSVQMGLGYSTVEGMQLQLDVAGVPWLTVPCPVAIPDPRASGSPP